MKFGTHIYVPLRMNFSNFGGPLNSSKDVNRSNFKLSYSLVYDKISNKDMPIILSRTLCLVLVSKLVNFIC